MKNGTEPVVLSWWKMELTRELLLLFISKTTKIVKKICGNLMFFIEKYVWVPSIKIQQKQFKSNLQFQIDTTKSSS